MLDINRPALAALSVLIMIHAIMLISLFAGVEPHPPARVAPFGMAPFLSAMMAAAVAAMILGPLTMRSGQLLTLLAMVLSLVSFGPHKLIDPALPLIWPGLASVWIALITLATLLARARRA